MSSYPGMPGFPNQPAGGGYPQYGQPSGQPQVPGQQMQMAYPQQSQPFAPNQPPAGYPQQPQSFMPGQQAGQQTRPMGTPSGGPPGNHPEPMVQRINLYPAIISYPSLHQPKVWPNQEPNKKSYYQADFWFIDSAPRYMENYQEIMQLKARCVQANFGSKHHPDEFENCVRVLSREKTKSNLQGFRIRGKSVTAPAVIRKDTATGQWMPVPPEHIYPGLVVGANFTGHAWSNKGKLGFSLWLNQVMVLSDGDRIVQSASGDPDELFGSQLDSFIGQFDGGSQAMAGAPGFAPSGGYGQPQMPAGMPGGYGQPQMPAGMPGAYGQPQMPAGMPGAYGQPQAQGYGVGGQGPGFSSQTGPSGAPGAYGLPAGPGAPPVFPGVQQPQMPGYPNYM